MPIATIKMPETIRLVPSQLKRYFEEKLAAELGPHDLKHLIDSEPDELIVLDVRSKDGYRGGHIPGAVNIPLEELTERFKELPRTKQIVTYCWNATCLLCTRAAHFLAS